MALLKRQKAGAVRNKGKEGQDSWRGLLPGDKGLPALVARWALVSSAVLWGEFTAHAASGSSRCVHAGGSTSCPRPGIPLVLSTGEADDLTKPPATTPSGGREAGHLGPEGTHGQACFKDRTLLSRKKPGHPEAAGEVEGAGTQVQAEGSPWSQTSGMPKRRRFPAGVCLWVNC